MKYIAKKYARDEITARAFLAGHGTTFLTVGQKLHYNKTHTALYGFSMLHGILVYCIIATNGTNDLETIKLYKL